MEYWVTGFGALMGLMWRRSVVKWSYDWAFMEADM
jgi:hypothetical protein